MEPRYRRPLKAMVAPPEDAESDDPWVVPLPGLLNGPVSEMFGSFCPLADGCTDVATAPETPPESTKVTMGTDGIAPSGAGVTAPATLAVAPADSGAVGTGFDCAGLVTAGSLGGFVGAAGFDVGVANEAAGAVTTEDTMGVSAWNRSTPFTISF